jgi:hypothetical protein
MHKLIEYIDDEIMSIEKKAGSGKLSMSELQYLDTLAHAKKNLLKADEIGGYSSKAYSYGHYTDRGYSRDDDRRDAASYARGRGPYAARDDMGRYSSAADDLTAELRDLMSRAPEDKKQEFQRFIAKLERM